MNDIAKARITHAITRINDGRLPSFQAMIDGQDCGEVQPYDGTPEEAIAEIARGCASPCMVTRGDGGRGRIVVYLLVETAYHLIAAVPEFYAGRISWVENVEGDPPL